MYKSPSFSLRSINPLLSQFTHAYRQITITWWKRFLYRNILFTLGALDYCWQGFVLKRNRLGKLFKPIFLGKPIFWVSQFWYNIMHSVYLFSGHCQVNVYYKYFKYTCMVGYRWKIQCLQRVGLKCVGTNCRARDCDLPSIFTTYLQSDPLLIVSERNIKTSHSE